MNIKRLVMVAVFTIFVLALAAGGPVHEKTGTEGLFPKTAGQKAGQGKNGPQEKERSFKYVKEEKPPGEESSQKSSKPGLNRAAKPGSRIEPDSETGRKRETTIQASLDSGKSSKQRVTGNLEPGKLPGNEKGLFNRCRDNGRAGYYREHCYFGYCKITAYTAGKESTGKEPGDPYYGITATGVQVEEGMTAAADWDLLPPGTVVHIEGLGQRTIEDKGGAVQGRHIDVYLPPVEKARAFGVQERRVHVIKWPNKIK